MPYVWVLIAVLAAIVEFSCPVLFWIWFSPASLLAFAAAVCGGEVYLQSAIFFGFFIAMFVLSRTVFRRFFFYDETDAEEAMIGREGIVLSKMDKRHSIGYISVFGRTWQARSCSRRSIPAGSIVVIKCVQNHIMICKIK